MRLNTYVQKRTSGYFYRQRIPVSLKSILEQSEVSLSLKTKRASLANKRAMQVMSSVNCFLEEIQHLRDEFGHEAAKALAQSWKHRALNIDFENRLAGTPTHIEESEKQVMESLARMDFRQRENWINEVVDDLAPNLKPHSQAWRRAGYYLLLAKAEYLKEMKQRSDSPHTPMTFYEAADYRPPLTGNFTKPSNQSERLSDMLSRWENDGERKLSTVMEWQTAIRRFIEFKGDMPISEITTADIRDFKDVLKLLPKRVYGENRKLPLPQLVAKFKNKDFEKLHPKTINTQLSAVRSVLTWCVNNGFLEKNPAHGIMAVVPKVQAKKRLPFDGNDLKAIFETSPIFLDDQRPRAGAGEAAYWLPVLALYTGARLEELGQLLTSDVKEENGVWFLDINVEGEKKRLKTVGSQRRIPLHKAVIECGFLRYLGKQKKYKQHHLFHLLRHEQDKCTRMFSKWVNGYFRRVCGVTDSRKVFHSFRHSFKDACRNARIDRDIHNALTGHVDSSVSSKYGLGFNLVVLNEEIQKIEFPVKIPKWQG